MGPGDQSTVAFPTSWDGPSVEKDNQISIKKSQDKRNSFGDTKDKALETRYWSNINDKNSQEDNNPEANKHDHTNNIQEQGLDY